jgi:transcription elongation factor Elf1
LLTSLKGAPKEVGRFDCSYCVSLTSLEGAPEKVKGNFNCKSCGTRFAGEDIKKLSDIKGYIDC